MKQLEKIRFGIEIEVEFPDVKSSGDLIERNRVIRGWKIDYDGSLDNGAEYKALDKNKLYFDEESLTQIKEIIALIKVHKGNVRPTCGLHIHVDMTHFSNKEIANIINSFINKQKTIVKNFKVIKQRLNDAARFIPPKMKKYVDEQSIKHFRKYQSVPNNLSYFRDRHYMLNIISLLDHKTLEFRFFNGTIMNRKIKGHIKWVLNFCIKNSKN